MIATPIGHLGDMTHRGLDILDSVDRVVCEDTRHSQRLLNHYGISKRLTAYHDHNGARIRPKLIEQLISGLSMALITDSGTPVISDPGYRLVKEAREAHISVYTVPGPSALTAALAVAGLPTDRFLFVGFLPSKGNKRSKAIEGLQQFDASLILYEAPSRLASLLADLDNVLGGREAAICRELTKVHEEVRRGKLHDLARFYSSERARGELVVVIGPPEKHAPKRDVSDNELRSALRRHKPTKAATLIASETGHDRQQVYQRLVRLRKE